MKLVAYYTPMTSATRMLWALEELEVPYERVKIDLTQGEQRTAQYLAMNPNGKVPLLVADGQPIFESIAILAYLGETFGVDKGLYPAPGLDRARALQWLAWAGVTVGEAVSRFFRNTHERYPAEQRNAAAAEAARQDVRALLGILDGVLTQSDYLVGNSFSFADIPSVSYCFFAERLGLAELSGFPSVGAWVARCAKRPALLRAQAI